jgi:hypothetical protein
MAFALGLKLVVLNKLDNMKCLKKELNNKIKPVKIFSDLCR